MTPDERNLLDQFLGDLARARPGQKDAEAADRIERALRGNPDAAYVLVQHAILADQALAAAQQHIAELEQGPPVRDDRPGFLGGGASPAGYGYGQTPPPPPSSSVPPTGPGYGYGGAGPAWGGGGQPGPFSGGGGIGNFLKTAGTAAAGVAGGAFLFEGLSSMFGGHHGGGMGFGGFGGNEPQNVTINEYGDGDRGDGDFGYDNDQGYDDN